MICKSYVKCLKVLEKEWLVDFLIWEKYMLGLLNDFDYNVSYCLVCKMFL